MRIAVFHNLSSGGAKRVLHDFVANLASAGHDIDAFCPSTANEEFLPLKQVARKVEVFPVRSTLRGAMYSRLRYVPVRGASLRDQEQVQRRIADAVNAGDYDIVLSEQDQFTMSPFVLKFLKKPAVYYCQQPSRFHDSSFRGSESKSGVYPSPTRWRSMARKYYDSRLPDIDRKNASRAKYMLANSNYSRECILRSYGQNAHVSYLGVDTRVFKEQGVPRENLVVSVGSCFSSKGFDFIVDSLAMIEKMARPELVLVSNAFDPLWKQYLERLAAKQGVRLQFKILLDDGGLVSLYNRSSLVVYAPYLEPFGLVPIESMACGTPVVAVREGGIKESVVDGETGLLTSRDEAEFSEAVSGLLADASQRERMGRKSVEAVRNHWTAEHASKRLLAHLERAAKG